MRVPPFVNDDESTLGLVRRHIINSFRVSFLAKVIKFDPVKQTIDAKPVIAQKFYSPSGTIEDIPWSVVTNVPLCTIGFGSWYLTMPVDIGTTVLIVCNDLNFREWYQRNQDVNTTNTDYHSLNNAIAIAGINSSLTSIPDYATDGPEIKNVNGDFSLKISENGIQTKVGQSLVLDITGESISITIGGTKVAEVTSSGITMDTLDITIQGTKLYDWLTTHTHGYVSPGGPAITDPAGPQSGG